MVAAASAAAAAAAAAAAVPTHFPPIGTSPASLCTPVRDQGNDGRCASWSVAACMETLAARQHGSPATVAFVSVDDVFEVAKKQKVVDAVTDAVAKGVVDEECRPVGMARCADAPARLQRATFTRLLAPMKQMPALICRHLAQTGPVVIEFPIFDDPQWDTLGAHDFYAPPGGRPQVGAHAVCLVGYEPGIWIAKNSYGTAWGNDGFLRLRWSDAALRPEAIAYGITQIVGA
ncbi:MAG: C1 family peptidase [Gemmatimonadaceae bacterium]